jgi:hypothetical protein
MRHNRACVADLDELYQRFEMHAFFFGRSCECPPCHVLAPSRESHWVSTSRVDFLRVDFLRVWVCFVYPANAIAASATTASTAVCVSFLSKKVFFFGVIRHADDLPRRLLDDAREDSREDEEDSWEDDEDDEGEDENSRDWWRLWRLWRVDVICYIRREVLLWVCYLILCIFRILGILCTCIT